MLVDMNTLPPKHPLLTYTSIDMFKFKVSVEKVAVDAAVKSEYEVLVCYECASHNKDKIMQNWCLEDMLTPCNTIAIIASSQDTCHSILTKLVVVVLEVGKV